MACTVQPISAFQSTNLSSKIDSFCRLGDRIVRTLGAPLVTIEVHQDQIFENIAIACEMFSKFAGYTQEYIVFDSDLYEERKGIRMDHLFTIANSKLTTDSKLTYGSSSPDASRTITKPDTMYICTSAVHYSLFLSVSSLSGTVLATDGLYANQIIDLLTYNSILTGFSTNISVSAHQLSAMFISSVISNPLTLQGSCTTNTTTKFNNMFDYDVMDYRKVIAITDFEEGSTTGINTLFTIEQTMAQQTYFSYAMGNYGFDLVSWYTLKNWLKDREKLLAIRRSIKFDERTQYLTMYPEPTENQFWGVLSCYIERPLRDIIKEPWVYQYALALTKIAVGNVRGKYGNLTVFGGQIFSSDLMTQGLAEKAALEERLYTGASPGFGDADPPIFLIG